MTTFNPARRPEPTTQELISLREKYRDIAREVFTALKEKLVRRENIARSPTPPELRNRARQLEKAFELHRGAETQIELLVAYFGGSL